jgi:hypothetical protein
MQMNLRGFVPSEANVSELASFTRLNQSSICPFWVEHSMRVLESEDFVVLDEIDAINLQALQ